jgi:hypothetical protein
MSTATVYDFTPAQFRRTTGRQTSETTAAQTIGIFDDVADGILVLDFALTFAGFSYEARQLNLSIVGLLGSGKDAIEMFDEELAEHLNCSVRTVRYWRAANLKETESLNFGFIQITEGEYDSELKRYKRTKYQFTGAAYIEAAVTDARGSEEYKRDRRPALEKAARDHYDEIPNSPPRRRNKKPKPAPTLKIERDFINASRSIAKGKMRLNELPERTRAAFLAGAQGEELRALLVQMQREIANVLQDFSQTVDNTQVKDIPAIFAGTPPDENFVSEAVEDEPSEPKGAVNLETPCSVREEETLHGVEDVPDWWQGIEARLNAPPIRRTEVALRQPEPPGTECIPNEPPWFDDTPVYEAEPEPSELTYELDPIEQAEAEAVQAEANNLPLEPDEVLAKSVKIANLRQGQSKSNSSIELFEGVSQADAARCCGRTHFSTKLKKRSNLADLRRSFATRY